MLTEKLPVPASCSEHHQLSNKPAARLFPRLSQAAQPYSPMKGITVFKTARGRASTVGREEAVERRRRVNSTQALVGRFSRRSAIPSSRDWPCAGEWCDWDSTVDTFGHAGLRWPPVGAACRSVRLPVSDEVEAGLREAWALTTRLPRTTWFQPWPSLSCSGEGSAGSDLGAGRRVETLSFGPHSLFSVCRELLYVQCCSEDRTYVHSHRQHNTIFLHTNR
jgi:hypothetical protein